MASYGVTVIITVILSSIPSGSYLYKKKMLDIRTIVAIALSSVVISVLFPYILSFFMVFSLSAENSFAFILGALGSLLITFVVFIALVLLATMVICTFVSDQHAKTFLENIRKGVTGIKNTFHNILKLKSTTEPDGNNLALEGILGHNSQAIHRNKAMDEVAAVGVVEGQEVTNAESGTTGKIEDGADPANVPTEEEFQDDVNEGKNILEKCVDTEQITDKMGIDIVQPQEATPLEVNQEVHAGQQSDAVEFDIENDYFDTDGLEDVFEEYGIDYHHIEESESAPDEVMGHTGLATGQEQALEVEETILDIERLGEMADLSLLDLDAGKSQTITEEILVEVDQESKVDEEGISEGLETSKPEAQSFEDNAMENNEEDDITGNIGEIQEEQVIVESEIEDTVDSRTPEEVDADGVEANEPGQNVGVQENGQSEDDGKEPPAVDEKDASILGSEPFVIDESLGLEDYIEQAFKRKEEGELEDAILCYMYALDKKPKDEVVFWIIVDICVLYKQMGQKDIARQILEGFMETYGDVMDASIRNEIEKNLE